jgi:GT2 family glycosyltransferase
VLVRVDARALEQRQAGFVATFIAALRALVEWIRNRNRARLRRRRARQAEAAAALERAAARSELEDFQAANAPPSMYAHAAWAQTPASHVVTWGAYERLSAQMARRERERIAAFAPEPFAMFEPPADLTAYARAINLPAVAAPRASIIVPVFNHLRETLGCIASIAAHTPSGDFEVIVVDDASSDETSAVLPLIPNLRLLRNPENGGFILSCNRGAQEARGEYLVFLNNDAQVTAGWLEPLLDTFSRFDRVGAVGPKLVYPNGRLQEAGSMVNPDLKITMVGVRDDPARSRYNYPREVHYCTGACLVLQRRRFEEVGGFASELRPAHYEDCDLQLELRRRGLRSFYQPASVVVHHLSLTSEGLSDPKSFKKRQIVLNSQRMREKWGDVLDAMHAVRLIAFYLPQFHSIVENDLWWGKGFTEWTNVAKAAPNFVGHEQPHLPTELGFYDLRALDVMDEQARLARGYGISGFCYYYYWFAGKRILEMPIERLLESSTTAMPFCLCWANENWTRAWDGGGGESEILVAQAHSDEDDEAAIRDLTRYLRHQSYIRVNGKPMLLVYRVELFPDIRRTTERWREVCRREGIGELHLVRVDSFKDAAQVRHPSADGFDAAVEFPPHNRATGSLKKGLKYVSSDFKGTVYDYEEVVLRSATYKEVDYPYYRCVMPRWDNTPRRRSGATIFARSTPGAYQVWLEDALRYTREQHVGDERVLFVNAWNEWGEGAHLEPERRFGRSYLEATRNALGAHLTSSGD